MATTLTRIKPTGVDQVAQFSFSSISTGTVRVGNVAISDSGNGNIQLASVAANGQVGTPAPLSSSEFINFRQPGTLEVSTGTARWYAPAALTISSITSRIVTAPVGAAVVTRLNDNGSNVALVTIASGEIVGTSNALSINILQGNYLTIDVQSIGSSTPGADLYVTIEYQRD